jgi:GNAT superfamily N-acetyltransferase
MRQLPAGISARRATPADQPSVMELVLAGIGSYRDWAPDWTPQPPSPETSERLSRVYADDEAAWVFLAFAGDELVGLVSLAMTTGAAPEPPPPGTVYLWQMFVRTDWQGTGLAGALHDRVIEEARSRGFERMILWAAEGAAQARHFYEREGWEATGKTDPEAKFGLPLVQYGRSLHQ